MAKIKLIASIDKNGVIGNDGDLVLRHPEDMSYFKNTTLNYPIIMGRKTWNSLPNKPLKGRKNIVITRANKFNTYNVFYFNNIDDAIKYGSFTDEEVYVIGGGEIYNQTIDKADELLITRWFKEVNGDTFFPEIDKEKWVRKYILYPKTTKDFVFETWIKKS